MTKKYIKSPMNYTGGKFKLLPQLLPLMPENIDTFVDLFTGGCNVAVNVSAKSKVCNDKDKGVIGVYRGVQGLTGVSAKAEVEEVISKYALDKENKEGYLKCREDFNKSDKTSWTHFYALVLHAFNNQIRYNSKGEYNMPFGKGKSSFNPSLQGKFLEFVDAIDDSYTFENKDFRAIDLDSLSSDSFVYIDPPYLITEATYNSTNGGWGENEEQALYALMDKMNEKGIRFMLSNVFDNKGKSNDTLKEWAKGYNVHYIENTYKNCSYHAKDRESKTVEVVITNYDKN